MFMKDATKWDIEDNITKLKEIRDKLKQLRTAQDILNQLPSEITDLEFHNISIHTFSFSNKQIALWFYAPEQQDTLGGRALTLQWVKQTMELFKNLMNTVWDEAPLDADKKSRTTTYHGNFEYMGYIFSIYISGCPISANCKLIPRTHTYTTYDVKCPDDAELVEA
jgi:hypothetical protein